MLSTGALQKRKVAEKSDVNPKKLSERRLDTLARLLQGRSECVAVSLINGKFFITANGSGKHNIWSLIVDVMNYLTSVVTQKAILEEDRKQILLRICSEKSSVVTKEIIHVPEEIIMTIVQHDENIMELFDKNKLCQKYSEAAGLVLGIFKRAQRDLFRLERFLQNQDSYVLEQSKDFHISINKYEIRITSSIHAELQILEEILMLMKKSQISTQGSKEIYFGTSNYLGISKLCCLHCHLMLETANKVFADFKIPLILKFRGAHDLDFDKNWTCPDMFEEGYYYEGSFPKQKEVDIAFQIGFRANKTIEEKQKSKKKEKNEEVGGYSRREQLPSPSSGSDIGLTIEEKTTAYESKLQQLQILAQLPTTMTVTEIISAVSLGLILSKLEDFKQLFDNEYRDASERKQIFVRIINKIQSQNPKITPTTLLQLLQTPIFVGKEIADYFLKLKLVINSTGMHLIEINAGENSRTIYSELLTTGTPSILRLDSANKEEAEKATLRNLDELQQQFSPSRCQEALFSEGERPSLTLTTSDPTQDQINEAMRQAKRAKTENQNSNNSV